MTQSSVRTPSVQDSFAHRVVRWWIGHSHQIAVAAVLLSLVLAGGYAVVSGSTLAFYDEREYFALVQSMADGHGFSAGDGSATAYRPPGYPLLLLPFYLLSGGSVVALRLVGVLCLAGSVWLAYLIGRRVHSSAVGALAAVGIALYPLIIYTATTLYPQVPAMFFLLLTIELGIRCTDATTRRKVLTAVGAGFAAGACTLVIPTFAPSLLILFGWLVWRARRTVDRTQVHRALAAAVVAAAVLPSLWIVRNAVVMDAFIPVATNSGTNLLLGNSDNVTAGGGRVGDISIYEKQAEQGGMDEIEQNDFFTEQAVAWIKDNPGRAARLYVGKVVNTFAFRNELATAGQTNTMRDLVSALTYYPILALALLRLLLIRRFPLRGVEKVIMWMIVANVLLLAIFFTRVRFRVPLDGLTIVLAAATVGCLVQRWRQGRGDGDDAASTSTRASAEPSAGEA
jgi:4-amino-4-deoxy-L-arabinose transferase-like glycosyltransferase